MSLSYLLNVKPTSRRGLALLAVAILLVSVGLIVSPTVGVSVLVFLMTAAAVYRPTWGLYLLALSAPWEEALFIPIGSIRLKPYEFILAGLVVVVVYRRWRPSLDLLTGAIALYVASGVLGLGAVPSIRDSIQTMLFQLLMVVLFVVVRAVLRQTSVVRQVTLYYVLVVGNAVGLYALGQLVGYYVGLPVQYFHPEAYALFRPYATFLEPNPYGGFIVSHLVLALVLAASPALVRWRIPLLLSAALQVFLLTANLSRASWIAFAAVVLAYPVVHFAMRRQLWRPALASCAGLVLFGISLGALTFVPPPDLPAWRARAAAAAEKRALEAAATPTPSAAQKPAAKAAAKPGGRAARKDGGETTPKPGVKAAPKPGARAAQPAPTSEPLLGRFNAVGDRLEDTLNPLDEQENTAQWRVRDARLAMQAWLASPLVGYGPGNWAGRVYGLTGRDRVQPPVNIVAAWLVERGLIGFLFAVTFYILVAWRVVRAVRRAPNELGSTLVLAHGLAIAAVFITFLSSTGEIVPYYWFHLGLLLAATDAALSIRAAPAGGHGGT